MNSYERMKTALEKGLPDRPPLFELSIANSVIRGLGCRDYFDVIDSLDLDGMTVKQVLYEKEDFPWIDPVKRIFKDNWGCRLALGEEPFPFLLDWPIRDVDDISRFSTPDPRDDGMLTLIPEFVRRYKGKKMIALLSRAVFATSWYLRGMENFLMDLVLYPDAAAELMEKVGRYYRELHSLAIEGGVDLIVLGDDYASKTGTIMSPVTFRHMILPGLSETVRNIKQKGGYCIKHTDGNVWAIIEDMVSTGADALGPLELEAGMNLAEVREKYGHRVAVMGNVEVDLLSRGSKEDIRREVEILLSRVSVKGGHIMSSGNSISNAVRPENYRYLVELTQSAG